MPQNDTHGHSKPTAKIHMIRMNLQHQAVCCEPFITHDSSDGGYSSSMDNEVLRLEGNEVEKSRLEVHQLGVEENRHHGSQGEVNQWPSFPCPLNSVRRK